MDTELMLDVGQANELKLAFRRAGYTKAEIKKLCEGDILGRLLPVVKGHAGVVMKEYLIDCDADPFMPCGLELESHQRGGQFIFDSAKVKLHLSPNQQGGKCIEGNKLRKELASELVLNANVLDYLLANPNLIPEEWKGKSVFFWGTIYRGSHGNLYVRYLCFYDGRWYWHYYWLSGGWGGSSPAALRVS